MIARAAARAAGMTHGGAVAAMVGTTLLWSTAGVVTRHLEASGAVQLVFWRSASCAIALAILLLARRGGAGLRRDLACGGPALWLSGLCWSVMFTAFMAALALTTVANVLVTMALAPLLTALLALALLRQRLALRTWAAVAAAGAGIAWMYASSLRSGDLRHIAGTAVALAVPLAAALNWTLLQRTRGHAGMMPAVLIGAVLSTLFALLPMQALAVSGHDFALLAMLGVFQLALPCLVAVAATRVLGAAEVSLLALLEVIFGVAWAWLGAGEAPTPAALGGGLVVLATLAAHELVALRSVRSG